jgi:hypothetical protein
LGVGVDAHTKCVGCEVNRFAGVLQIFAFNELLFNIPVFSFQP